MKQHLEDRGLSKSGLKGDLSARLKAAEKCDMRATGVGGAATSGGPVSNAGDLGDAPTEPEKRPRTEGQEEAPDPKRPRTLTMPLETLLKLFIAAALDSSEVVVRCRERQSGGAGAAQLSIRAGEVFEVEVRVKIRFATFDSALAHHMMREIVLLPKRVLLMQGEPRFSDATGVAIFSVRVEKAGDIAISAAIMMPIVKHLPPNLQRLQQGAAAPEICTIGGRGGVTTIKVLPGAMQFQSMTAKKKDVLGEQLEFELGEQVELMLMLDDSDQFGNIIQLPHRHREGIIADLISKYDLIHQHVAVPLQSMQLSFTKAGVAVRGMDLSVLGQHLLQIKCSSQDFATTVKVVPGMPHSLQLIGEGRAYVLRQWRWFCNARLLNKHGHPAVFSRGNFPEISVRLVPSQSLSGDWRGGQGLPLVAKLSEQSSSINGDADTAAQELQLFHIETSTPARKGDYCLQAKLEGRPGVLACDRAIIRLGLPLDPSSWEPQDLAESIRLSGVEVPDDVLKDEFGAQVSGKDLVESSARGKALILLIECLLQNRKFTNRQEKDDTHAKLKQVADDINEICTLAKLGKGKFKSSVAKCISESDLRCVSVSLYLPLSLLPSLFLLLSLSLSLSPSPSLCLVVSVYTFIDMTDSPASPSIPPCLTQSRSGAFR